jgi:HEAT repeat protein
VLSKSMRSRPLLLLLFIVVISTCAVVYPRTYVEIPRREIVRGSDVVAVAAVAAINGKVGKRIAHFAIRETLKGVMKDKYLDVPFIEKAEGPCSGKVSYNLDSEYVLFLREKANKNGYEYPGSIRADNKTTIQNIRRFVRIAETADMDKWQAPYLEIFQSGEFDFFMEAYKALRNLNFNDRTILEQGILNQWNHLADSEWQRTYLLEPLVELKSKAAIPYLTEWAKHGASWNFRIDAMKTLIDLQADGLKDLFIEISRTDPDPAVQRAAYSNIAKLSGKDAGDYLQNAISNEKDAWTRAELLRQLADMGHPATYSLAEKAFSSMDSSEKEAACAAFAKLRDRRAYPMLLKALDSADTGLYKRELIKALIAIDDESASQVLISRLNSKDSSNIIDLLGDSRSPYAFSRLHERFVKELAAAGQTSSDNQHVARVGSIAESLISMDPIKAKDIVLPLIKHPNEYIQYWMINLLGRTKAQWAFDKLVECLSDSSVNSGAAAALLKIDYDKASATVLRLMEDKKIALTPDLRETFAEHREQRSLVILEKALLSADDDFSRSLLQDAIMRIKAKPLSLSEQ